MVMTNCQNPTAEQLACLREQKDLKHCGLATDDSFDDVVSDIIVKSFTRLIFIFNSVEILPLALVGVRLFIRRK